MALYPSKSSDATVGCCAKSSDPPSEIVLVSKSLSAVYFAFPSLLGGKEKHEMKP